MGAFKKTTSQGSGSSKTRSADDLFEALHPDKMLSNAQRVLSSAVNVLEEEIAAGILAAKKMEKKIIDVEDIREDPRDLMNRIRRDIHEAVDIFMDSVTAISRQLGALSGSIAKKEEAPAKEPESPKTNEVAIPVVTNNQLVKPGDTALLQLSLTNSSAVDEVVVQMRKTDLIGPGDCRINARNIRVAPQSLVLPPGAEKDIRVHIRVTKSTAPGLYCGLFTDANDATNRAIIHLQITA